MMFVQCECLISNYNPSSRVIQTKSNTEALLLRDKVSERQISVSQKKVSNCSVSAVPYIQSSLSQKGRALGTPREEEKFLLTISFFSYYLLYRMILDSLTSCNSGTLKWHESEVPYEKEALYGALDKWTALAIEFPLIAAVKVSKIIRKRHQWVRVIQVARWMSSKDQGASLGTYDTLLAFDMDQRFDEAESCGT